MEGESFSLFGGKFGGLKPRKRRWLKSNHRHSIIHFRFVTTTPLCVPSSSLLSSLPRPRPSSHPRTRLFVSNFVVSLWRQSGCGRLMLTFNLHLYSIIHCHTHTHPNPPLPLITIAIIILFSTLCHILVYPHCTQKNKYKKYNETHTQNVKP